MNVREAQELYLRHLPRLERIVRVACRRRPAGIDPEDFESIVKLRFIEDDYAIVRKFHGRSSFSTYMTIVVERMLLDQRMRQWGKWRPSAEARRLGDVAVRLEEMMRRDGLSFEEASKLIAWDLVDVSRRELDRIGTVLATRHGRLKPAGKPPWDSEATVDGTEVERTAFQRERERVASRVAGTLERAIAGLEPEERLLLKLRYHEELNATDIARTLGISSKVLYRRMSRVLRALRDALEAEGLDKAAAQDLLEHGAERFALSFAAEDDLAAASSSR
ncbi:MAG: sigma-70 family RNA polymerase sigma factor [Thermoanaerobaculia bacterium]